MRASHYWLHITVVSTTLFVTITRDARIDQGDAISAPTPRCTKTFVNGDVPYWQIENKRPVHTGLCQCTSKYLTPDKFARSEKNGYQLTTSGTCTDTCWISGYGSIEASCFAQNWKHHLRNIVFPSCLTAYIFSLPFLVSSNCEGLVKVFSTRYLLE